MARNETYFKGAPNLERFQLHVYGNSDAIVRALNISEVNAATDLPVGSLGEVNQERYDIVRQPINNGVYALFNTTTGVMSDIKVRQALQAGTDTQALRDAVGPNTPALSLPFIAGQVDGAPAAPAYNPERAATLLDEAGWTVNDNGERVKDGQPLKVNIVTTRNSDLERVLEALQGQWRNLGIAITTSIVDPSDPAQNVVQNILQPRNYDALLYQLTIGGDPDVYAYWHSSQASNGFNFSNYSNGVADDALASARDVTAKNLRDAKYVTFANQWLRDVPAIGLYQVTSQYVSSKNAQTLKEGHRYVSPIDRYADVLYWSVGDRFVQQTP